MSKITARLTRDVAVCPLLFLVLVFFFVKHSCFRVAWQTVTTGCVYSTGNPYLAEMVICIRFSHYMRYN